MAHSRDYALTSVIHDNPDVSIQRGRRVTDGAPVVVKTLKPEASGPREIARLKHEHAIASALRLPGVITTYGVEEHGSTVALVMEDFDARSLDHLIREGGLDLRSTLRIGIAVAEALAAIHQGKVIHKDIKPHNILVRLEPFQVKVSDFGIATRLSQETPRAQSPSTIEGSLAYMSPEQTGRMNRTLDHRTDLYSLGITLYEMTTGVLPFQAVDAMELIHNHIARIPAPPHELSPKIPRVLSDIVMKLTCKAPEDRYKSAHGLQVDLEECLSRLDAHGEVAPFSLAQRDFGGTLRLTQKLYGRDAAAADLIAAFDRTCDGAVELVLVSGHAGVGKSALVNEVHKAIARRKGGYFVSGKFSQLSRRVPYEAVTEAFRELCGYVAAEPAESLDRCKKDLLAALGPNGQVIASVVPEVAVILGPQPSVQPLGPTESQNRFDLCFQSFVRVFTAERPLVVFLDDLQWADPASLKLLRLLLADPAGRRLLVIGAYREKEVDDAHPLRHALQQIRDAGAHAVITEIELEPLISADVTQLVADALGSDVALAAPLAALILNKTDGNPFFINQMFRMLLEDDLLTFDAKRGAWVWDLERVEGVASTDNVVDLMISKIQRLTPAGQRVLELAACVGHHVDLRTLLLLDEGPRAETASALCEALREGFLLPLDSDYRFVYAGDEGALDAFTSASTFKIELRFLHDRVQQAAYSLIAQGQRREKHLRIGRLLSASGGDEPQEEALFDVINHLNLGSELIDDARERLRLARLNLDAGRRAKTATAFDAACGYLEAGASLLDESSWDDDHDLALNLHVERAECEYLCGRHEVAESLFDTLLIHAKTKLEQTRVHNMRALLLTTQGRFVDALRAGLAGLAVLGVDLPSEKEQLGPALGAALAEVDVHLAGRRIEDVVSASELTDEEQLEILALLGNLFSASYFLDPLLYTLINLKMVNTSLQHGNSARACLAYTSYGFILSSVMGRWREGYAFGRLGLDLNERFNSVVIKPQLYFFFGMILLFSKPLSEVFACLDQTQRVALEAGDLPFLAYACNHSIILRLARGDNLASLRDDADRFLGLTLRNKDTMSAALQTVAKQMIAALEGRTMSRTSFSDGTFDEAAFPATLEGPGFATAACWYYTAKVELLYLYGDYAGALAMVFEAEKKLSGGVAQFFAIADLPLYTCLTLAALPPEAAGIDAERHREMVEVNQNKLAILAEQCPETYAQKYLLAQAEQARVSGRSLEAVVDLFDRTITAAEGDFVRDWALANELCARFLVARRRPRFALPYAVDAHRGYSRWGATAKVADLEASFPNILERGGPAASPKARLLADLVETSPTATRTWTLRAEMLDAATVIRAAQAMAGEVTLDRVMDRLMRIVLQSAGAQRGALILNRDGRLSVEATVNEATSEVLVGLGLPLDACLDLPITIVRFVERTRQPLVLDHAAADARFRADPFILARRPKSILCMALTQESRLTGILYLENSAVEEAFWPGRIELLGLLSAQAAIAVENALLYADVRAASDELRRVNETLEGVVATRTDALRETNARLQVELVERESAERARAAMQADLLKAQSEKLLEMSTPLIPITDEIMVMPLIGTMDTGRAQLVLETALRGAQASGARAVIIDITGVRAVDTAVAATLIRTANALRLLGSEVVITGIRPEVAETLVQLQVNLGAIMTKGTLQSGIAYARERMAPASPAGRSGRARPLNSG